MGPGFLPGPIEQFGPSARYHRLCGRPPDLPVEMRGMPDRTNLGAGRPYSPVVALDAMPFAVLLADPAGRVEAVNESWTSLSGLSAQDSLGRGWLRALDPESAGRICTDLAALDPPACSFATDYLLLSRTPRRWTRWWISRSQQDPERVVVAVADVHDDRTREADLYHLATHDALTGLLNRSHFLECTEQALRRNERHRTRVGVVFVDLDGFKRVNDLGGHAVGNRVLTAVASRLSHVVRSADLVARIGGDEFAVLCEDLVDEDQAAYVVRRVSSALAESVEMAGESWPVAASVGCAIDAGVGDAAEALLDRADRAMYRQKAARRPGEQYVGGAAPTTRDWLHASPADETLIDAVDTVDVRAAEEAERAEVVEVAAIARWAATPPTTSPPILTRIPAGNGLRSSGTAAGATATTSPTAAPTSSLLADIQVLRQDLEAIRARLDRLGPPVVDVRDVPDMRRNTA